MIIFHPLEAGRHTCGWADKPAFYYQVLNNLLFSLMDGKIVKDKITYNLSKLKKNLCGIG